MSAPLWISFAQLSTPLSVPHSPASAERSRARAARIARARNHPDEFGRGARAVGLAEVEVLERGVVAGDAVELLGALVRGNGDERATGAGGVVRELAGQAAQAREAGTADALGEGREEEDRVCVATHDLRDESSLPDSTRRRRAGRAASDGAPATARDASLAQLQRAATSPKYGSRRNTRPSDWRKNREIAKRELQMCSRSAAAAAALSPRRPRRFGRGRRFPWSS